MFKNCFSKLFLTSIFLLMVFWVNAQDEQKIIDFRNKLTKNSDLLAKNPDKAFLEIENLIKEARANNDKLSELSLIERSCWYYNYRSDIENLISTAKLLQQKAIDYKTPYFEAIAHTYMQCAYTTNNLYDNAIVEFDNAMAILEKQDQKNRDNILAKYNAYTYLANLYNYKKEQKKALQNLLNASKELKKLQDKDKSKSIAQYHNYANIASCYIEIDIDSAEYYVKKSIEVQLDSSRRNNHVVFSNYSSLGHIEWLRENFREALVYYHKAEAVIPDTSSVNLENRANLYDKIQSVYESLLDSTNVNVYRLKSKEAKLYLEQSKNKSLHKILEDTPKNNNNSMFYIMLVISGIALLLCIVFIIKLNKKNQLLQNQESQSKKYLEEIQNIPSTREESYKELLEMVQNNNPDFLDSFHETYPDFEDKISKINSSIAPTEMEFCALLKMNIPTKEIARYKNLEPRSVQTKKYRIRKKLDIPGSEDIYFWFNKI